MLLEMRVQYELIQHVLAALLVYTLLNAFFVYRVYDNTPYVSTINTRKSNQHTSSWSTRQTYNTFPKTTHEKSLT